MHPLDNIMRTRAQASKEARRSAGGWAFNPFTHNYTPAPPPRANTLDAEQGQTNRYNTTDGLTHAATAPSQIHHEQSDVTAVAEDEIIPVGEVGSERALNEPGSGLRQRVGTGSVAAAGGDAQKPENEKPKEKLTLGFLRHIPPKEPYTWKNQLRRTVGSSWINILLVCAPVGIVTNYTGVSGQAVFAINFIAIIPLAAMLGFATEEIALRTGETLGGLINATFG